MQGVLSPILDSSIGFFFIAEEEGKRIGSLFVTKEWNTWQAGEWWFLYDVYVLPEFRRKGVFENLFQKVEEVGKQDKKFRGIRLFVLESNLPAKKAYEKVGMQYLGRELWKKPFLMH